VIFIEPINKNRKKSLPNILKDIIITFIYLIAASVIITVVYGKTILSIWTFFSSWAIIGFAKDIIAECMYGIIWIFKGILKLGIG